MTTGLRVLHAIPSISPRRGGPSAAIIPMIAALRARGIEAEIATTDEDFKNSATAPSISRLHGGVPVRFFPRWIPPLPALREFSYSASFGPWLERNIAGYDLLHVHALFSYLPTAAMRTARRHGIPYISRPLGQLGSWPLRQSALRKKIYLRLMEARNLRGAAALHFTSKAERSEAALVGFSSCAAVIPHGIELPPLILFAPERLRSELEIPSDHKIVLFLGRIHPKKGLDLLVTAFSRIKERRIMLLLAGEGPHRPEIERLIGQLGLVSHVRWLGQVTGERKQLCLQGADLFALTSRHENMGVAVLESLAAGTPVLISEEVALAGEVAGHGLGTVVPLECGAIAGALSHALSGPPDTGREQRRDFVGKNYSWPANATALENLYQDILKNRTRRPGWPRLKLVAREKR